MLATWLIKLDDLAKWSAKVWIQLGKLVPKRLTGSADHWYWSLPVSYCRNVLGLHYVSTEPCPVFGCSCMITKTSALRSGTDQPHQS